MQEGSRGTCSPGSAAQSALPILLAWELGAGRAPFASPACAWAAMGTLPPPLPCGGELSSVAAMGVWLAA